jgi:hypothetical protein
VAHWYDPRSGAAEAVGRFDRATRTFTPPSSGAGQDWVLVLDDESRGFSPPGVL